MTGVDLGRPYKRMVQYFWDPEPRNDDASHPPIWCLGQEYAAASKHGPISNGSSQSSAPGASQTPSDPPSQESGDGLAYDETTRGDRDRGWPTAFLDDFDSKIWLSYRSNFPPIPKSPDPQAAAAMTFTVRLRSQLLEQGGFTSDTGWGCMIRSGQNILANALVLLRLGRDWRRGSREREERNIISLFADDPRAPFSIHRFVEHGATSCGKHPGEWFGPSATAQCIQALSTGYESSGLRVYITGDGSDVYEDSLMKAANPDGKGFQPTLVLVGIRLGIDRVTPVYWEALRASLLMSQSVGIAGGRPSSSHYFIGVQGPYFFYLDPHQTRPALPLHEQAEGYTAEEIDSCHTRRLRRLHISEMDPSMLIAFLIRDEDDWKSWRRQVAAPGSGKAVIHVADNAPTTLGHGLERAGALDEVEILDDDDDEGIGSSSVSGSYHNIEHPASRIEVEDDERDLVDDHKDLADEHIKVPDEDKNSSDEDKDLADESYANVGPAG
ncbi:MAG: Cysteine protease atg4 [Thelocarpon superellum]|nr:MAG: Cysteine protease atg4 [Thelocarpon superellum]